MIFIDDHHVLGTGIIYNLICAPSRYTTGSKYLAKLTIVQLILAHFDNWYFTRIYDAFKFAEAKDHFCRIVNEGTFIFKLLRWKCHAGTHIDGDWITILQVGRLQPATRQPVSLIFTHLFEQRLQLIALFVFKFFRYISLLLKLVGRQQGLNTAQKTVQRFIQWQNRVFQKILLWCPILRHLRLLGAFAAKAGRQQLDKNIRSLICFDGTFGL